MLKSTSTIIGFSVEFCVYSYFGTIFFFNFEDTLLKSRFFQKIFYKVTGRRLAV